MNDLSQAMPTEDLASGLATAADPAADVAPALPVVVPAVAADAALDAAVMRATDALLAHQQADGHWVYELEADATIPAEYVLLVHYLGETPNLALEQKIARYLRRIQLPDGGWPLFTDGAMDVSASVKAYFALKMIGDAEDAEHMVRARQAILAAGGAETVNVFTRILLALFGVVTWYAVPMMPVEIMLLPKWFPFHLSKVSYWARTVIVPLLVLNAKRPVARNPRGVRIDELFRGAPVSTGLNKRAGHQSKSWFGFFRAVDGVLRVADPLFPNYLRQRAIDAAVAFVDERLNGEDGLGAIFPAMANTVMMYDVLGYAEDHPHRAIARKSVEKLLVIHEDEAYCQPCLSPVWDTSLAAHALLETGEPRAEEAARRGLEWLRPLQILDVRGDWISRRPDIRPGGWAFQYANPHYPDVDDTAVVAMAMHRVDVLDKTRSYGRTDRACARVGGGHAEQQRRLGCVRTRKHAVLPEQHSVLGPRRLARSADGRRLGPLPFDARADRRAASRERAGASRVPLHPRRPGSRRQLVRPLGHELHLRHVDRAVRAERGRPLARRPAA